MGQEVQKLFEEIIWRRDQMHYGIELDHERSELEMAKQEVYEEVIQLFDNFLGFREGKR